MSSTKDLDQARVSTIVRNESENTIPQVGEYFENRNSIELVDSLRHYSPIITPRTTDSNVLTQLTRDTNLQPFPQQVARDKEIMTSRNPPRNMWRIVATSIWSATGGWSDAAPGALLPFMEKYYGISYSVVSLIWMANAAGFILIAMLSHKIQPWFGKRNSMIAGCCFSTIMYALVSSGSHFPLIVVGFFFGGMGLATCLSQANVFLARLDKLSKYLSIFHGMYGLGATASPLVATTMANSGISWHYFYLIILGAMLFNAVNFYFAFTGSDEDLKRWDTDETTEEMEGSDIIDNRNDSQAPQEGDIGLSDLSPKEQSTPGVSNSKRVSHSGDMILALKNSRTWLLAFFVLFYQGAEVSMAGWVVTFLLDYRKGNKSSVGYIASGFWGGLTIGRLLITRPLHKMLGCRRAVTLLSLTSIVLIALTWAIPNVISSGVFVSLAGVVIGPNYPLQITLSAQLIPRKIQVISLTIITAFGSSGGAIFPFLVGLISQAAGTFVVLPIFIGLYTCMLITWILLPNIERTKEATNIWERIW